MKPTARSDVWIPLGLLLLTAVPFLAGLVRLASLAGGGPPTPENSRFFADPLPVVLHIVGATLFCVLGAWQFSPGFRRQNPRWHRLSGRILVPSGMIAGLSGVWMALAYPLMPELQGEVLLGFRLLFGPAMVVCLGLAWTSAVQRRFVSHRAWMIRGYALGQAAGTQALIGIPWMLLVGPMEGLTRDLLMGAGWILNAAVAEGIIRRRAPGGRKTP